MGFGLLFIGYFIAFLMSVSNYGFAFEIIGFAIILSATSRLADYKHSISHVSLPLLLMALCSAYDGFRMTDLWMDLDLPLFGPGIEMTVSLIAAASTLLFHFQLLSAIRAIATDAEEKAIAGRAYLAFAVAAVSCILEFAVAIIGKFSAAASTPLLRILVLIAALVRILYPFAVLAFIYTCYARLCAPEDVDMPERPSRFAFINRMRQRREQKANEVKALRDGYQKKLEEKFHEKNSSKKSKKK